MNNRQRFKSLMAFAPVDRLPVVEWASYWDKTVDRWHKEGLDSSLTDVWEIRRHFGLDSFRQYWIEPRSPQCRRAKSHGAPIISNMDEYLQIKPYLFPSDAFDRDMVRSWALEQQRGESVIWISLEGYFWFPRTLLGIEQHLYSYYDQPELIHTMNSDLAQFNMRVLRQFSEICVPDFMTIAEDMSYNNGPMISRSQFDIFMRPHYLEITAALKEIGTIPMVDSDGDILQLLPWLTEAGIEGVLPLERMAGVNVSVIRKQFPKFKMIGAFDKTVMCRGSEAMRAEFERLLPVMRQGGFIPSVDHQTPPEVSIENYAAYVSLLKEFCSRAVQV